MAFANLVVALILGLQLPFFIITLVTGIWAQHRVRSGLYGQKTQVLAWVSFVTSVLITVGYFGQVILSMKAGGGGGSLFGMLWVVLWSYFTYQSYRLLRILGAI